MYLHVEDSKADLASLDNTTYEKKKAFQLCRCFYHVSHIFKLK